MSLREERGRLRTDIDRILVTAEVAEQDAEALRSAVIDTLNIFAWNQQAIDDTPGASDQAKLLVWQKAAEAMAERLERLQRVRVATEPLTLPTLGLEL